MRVAYTYLTRMADREVGICEQQGNRGRHLSGAVLSVFSRVRHGHKRHGWKMVLGSRRVREEKSLVTLIEVDVERMQL